jgi:hypothetical protein
MIWRRTVVLFVAALIGSAVIGLLIHLVEKAHRAELSNCVSQDTEAGKRFVTVAQDSTEVGFQPCISEQPLALWIKGTMLVTFFAWIGFFLSLLQDTFLYMRGRPRGAVKFEFHWFR